jgi:S-adenosylmethionine:tRNA ribosyltransferase-isomerase
VVSQKEKTFVLKPSFPMKQLDAVLQKYGATPLPPYIKNSPLTEKQARQQYQAIFARVKGSVAAPTASLHFSKKLLDLLEKQGHQIAFITLHVNLGTFAPITQKQVARNKLHEEWFYIPEKTRKMIMKAQKEKQSIIACGTTVVRTLESEFRNQKIEARKKSKWQKTSLFIRPGYKFKIVDGLITNFHLPQSSLLMLVSAFASKKQVLALYQEAIKNKYRFYSFGDGMLILK